MAHLHHEAELEPVCPATRCAAITNAVNDELQSRVEPASLKAAAATAQIVESRMPQLTP